MPDVHPLVITPKDPRKTLHQPSVQIRQAPTGMPPVIVPTRRSRSRSRSRSRRRSRSPRHPEHMPKVVILQQPSSYPSIIRDIPGPGAPLQISNDELGIIEKPNPVVFTRLGTVISETPVAASYTVDGESTIPSDGVEHQVSVAVLPFHTKVSYITVPRVDPRVFLQVCASNDLYFIRTNSTAFSARYKMTVNIVFYQALFPLSLTRDTYPQHPSMYGLSSYIVWRFLTALSAC